MNETNRNSVSEWVQSYSAYRRRLIWLSCGVAASFVVAACIALAIWMGSNGMDIEFSRAGR
jgi:type IV secretory pathway component VirB8